MRGAKGEACVRPRHDLAQCERRIKQPNGVHGGSGCGFDTEPVRTDYVYINLTLSVDEETLSLARRRAEALGTSVNQLVRGYLRQLAGKSELEARAEDFVRLSP